MEAENNKYYLNEGSMDKTFFDEYIRHQIISSGCKKKCDKILEDFEFIEYYTIGLKSDRVACYSELWFLDINLDDNKYLPVLIEDINTSSYYSLSRCSMDNDYDEDNNYKTIDEILELCPIDVKETVYNILHNKI
jgi:hypothetical protein